MPTRAKLGNRRDNRRQMAAIRMAARERLTDQEQLDIIKGRPGESKREVARLNHRIQNPKPQKGKKAAA